MNAPETPKRLQDPDPLLALMLPTLRHTGISANTCVGPSVFSLPCSDDLSWRTSLLIEFILTLEAGATCCLSRHTLSQQVSGDAHANGRISPRFPGRAARLRRSIPPSPRTTPAPRPPPASPLQAAACARCLPLLPLPALIE